MHNGGSLARAGQALLGFSKRETIKLTAQTVDNTDRNPVGAEKIDAQTSAKDIANVM